MKKIFLTIVTVSCIDTGTAMQPERMEEENANLRAQVNRLTEQNDDMFAALQQTSAQPVIVSREANLVSREHFDLTMEHFSEQLRNLSSFVRRGQMTLDAALSIAESEHRRGIETMLMMAGASHRDQLENAAARNRVELDHQEEINRLERERLQAIADAERTQREIEERERILIARIGSIVGHYHLDPVSDRISYSSLDISRMDIFQRHSLISEVYEKKFMPFRELFDRADLSVVEQYKNDTLINAEPVHPGSRENANTPWGTGIPGVRGWTVANSWFLKRWTGDQTTIIFVKEGSYSEVPDFIRDHWNPALAAYDRALAEYNRLKDERATRIEEAKAIVFPSETFDRLTSQVNEFLGKLM